MTIRYTRNNKPNCIWIYADKVASTVETLKSLGYTNITVN